MKRYISSLSINGLLLVVVMMMVFTCRIVYAGSPASDAVNQLNHQYDDGGASIQAAIQPALYDQVTDDARIRRITFAANGSNDHEDKNFYAINESLHPSRVFSLATGAAPTTEFIRQSATAHGSGVARPAVAGGSTDAWKLFNKRDLASSSLWPGQVHTIRPVANTSGLPQGNPGLMLRALVAVIFSLLSVVFALATLQQVRNPV